MKWETKVRCCACLPLCRIFLAHYAPSSAGIGPETLAQFEQMKGSIIRELGAPPSNGEEALQRGRKTLAIMKHLKARIRDPEERKAAKMCLSWFNRVACGDLIQHQTEMLNHTARVMEEALARSRTAAARAADANNRIAAANVVLRVRQNGNNLQFIEPDEDD